MLLTLPIREVVPATPRASIVRLDLEGRTFPYEPGQAVLVSSPGDSRKRAYSLAAAPEDAKGHGFLELLVGTDGSGSSGRPALSPGTSVDVEGPVGRFTFPANPVERRFVFLAAGTGIAPLRSMLRHALATQCGDIRLMYSARTQEEFAYEEELRGLARNGQIWLQQTITRGGNADGWTGAHGRIGLPELRTFVNDCEALCFICGPTTFVSDMRRLLGELGVTPDRVRIEVW